MRVRELLPLVILISGCCVANNGLEYEAVSTINQYHLARLQKGMGEKTVLHIMHKPYSYETFQVGDDIYDVWFYVTRPTGLDQTRMVPQNLTPLTFKNGALVGVGYNWYYYAMKEQAAETAAQSPEPEKPKSQDAEDKEFEKALKTYPEKAPDKAQPEKKLPPNVHIISENEEAMVDPCECAPREAPCCIPAERVCKMDRFSGLSKGMTESQILDLFGEPIKRETFQVGDQTYDGWFYDTIPSNTGKSSTIPQHQTILTFENTLLMSVNDEEFYKLKENQTPVSVISEETFLKVYEGMTESEAMQVLGRSSEGDTFVIGEDTYNIWFYEVGMKKKMIPLTFKNGVLVGMTQDDYKNAKDKSEQDRIDCYDGGGERMQEDESEQNFNYW